MTLQPGPRRPGLRRGVECEGRYAGTYTLVVLGAVDAAAVRRGLTPAVEHVFWELGDGQPVPLDLVAELLRSGLGVTVESDDPSRLASLPAGVERVLRVPAPVHTLKVATGRFATEWARVGEWHLTVPGDYRDDEELT